MFDIKVTPDSGDVYTVTANPRDVLQWERTGKGRAFGHLAEELRITDVYSLAYTVVRRKGLFEGSLAEFEATCEVLPVDSEADEPDPTQPAP